MDIQVVGYKLFIRQVYFSKQPTISYFRMKQSFDHSFHS